MSEQFWIKEKQMDAPTASISVGGRLGGDSANELRTWCVTLRDKGYRHLILDMSEVTFIASSGIGALIVLTGEFDIQGGSAHLVALSQSVQRTIKLLNLTKFLKIEKSEKEVLAALQA